MCLIMKDSQIDVQYTLYQFYELFINSVKALFIYRVNLYFETFI